MKEINSLRLGVFVGIMGTFLGFLAFKYFEWQTFYSHMEISINGFIMTTIYITAIVSAIVLFGIKEQEVSE